MEGQASEPTSARWLDILDHLQTLLSGVEYLSSVPPRPAVLRPPEEPVRQAIFDNGTS